MTERNYYEENECNKNMLKAVNKLSDCLNNFNYTKQADAFFNSLNLQHWTIQQNFWRMIVKTMKKYGEQINFDARNEQAVTFCKVATTMIEENILPGCFPTI